MNDKISHEIEDENIPGVIVALTPAEAERQGIFIEDAISLDDVEAATADIAPDEDVHHGE